MTSLEELGLLKMDFLGLRTLTVINDEARQRELILTKYLLMIKRYTAFLQEDRRRAYFNLSQAE